MAIAGTSSSSSSSGTNTNVTGGTTGIANNFDQFLTLLTTQLKNQSPLDPMDTNQFTAQLVQFAGVEQQLKTNETLGSLLSLTSASTATNAVGFIGSTITTDGATTHLADDKAEWKVNMPQAGSGTITIKDSNGNVVYSQTKALTAGDQTYSWDGTTSVGAKAPDGLYTITIDAKNVGGETITAKTQISGVVDGVDFSGSIPMLKIGDISVALDKVKSLVRTAS